jgi:hypothetical protein
MLIGALNPCPCGHRGERVHLLAGHGQPLPGAHSFAPLPSASLGTGRTGSGPLLDRSAQPPRGIDTRSAWRCRGWNTRSCRAIAWASRRRPSVRGSRWHGRGRHAASRAPACWPTPTHLHLRSGASVGPAEVRDFCAVDDAGPGALWAVLRAAMQQRPGGTRMSARAYHRTRSVKLARTIADPSLHSGQAWRAASGLRRCILRIRSGQVWRPAPASPCSAHNDGLRSRVLRKEIQYRPRKQS